MWSKYDEARARRVRGEQGFTLIELLVVVVILGILVAVAIPVYMNYQDNAKKKSVQADVRSSVPAVELCLSKGTALAECELVVSPGNAVSVTAADPVSDGYRITGTREVTTELDSFQAVYHSKDGTTVITPDQG